MTNPITLIGFRSFLKVMKKEGIETSELAQVLTDELGVYAASDLAHDINELEKSIPENEPLS